MKVKSLQLIVFILLLNSCAYEVSKVDESEVTFDAPVDFGNFLVVGDMHSSGFMDGALYDKGLKHSYPSMVIEKISESTEIQAFTQANVSSENGLNREVYIESSGDDIKGKFYLRYQNENRLYPSRKLRAGQMLDDWRGSADTLKNFSFPGLRVYEIAQPFEDAFNMYIDRVKIDDKPILDIVISNSPEVILVDLGSEDILHYALYGASGKANPAMDEITRYDLTPVSVFDQSINEIVSELLEKTNAHIFIGNLSDPLISPYFTTIDWIFEPEIYSVSYLNDLKFYYSDFLSDVALYNRSLNEDEIENQRPVIDFDIEGYPLVSPRFRARVIEDESLNEVVLEDGTVIPKWRPMVEGEKILYKVESQLHESSKLSGEVPLSDEMVLTLDEIETINLRRASFNNIIKNIAVSENRITLIDIDSAINSVHNGEYSFGGVKFTTNFDRYGIYSADGYSLNQRGNAVIANEFIDAVNEAFGTNLEYINPNKYRGTEFLFSR